jgi:purine-binding chemotaxis protein CheW
MKPTSQKRPALDARQLRERLDRAIAATEQALRLSPEQAREVLQDRARALAQPPPTAPHAADVLEVVLFRLADEHYALESRFVREVVRLVAATPIPGTPDFLVGVINLRGEILAVFDLRPFFGLERTESTDLARVLVLGNDRPEFGILADEAREVVTVHTDEILEPPGSVAGVGREYMCGVTRDALVVLDGAVLLQDRRLYVEVVEDKGL